MSSSAKQNTPSPKPYSLFKANEAPARRSSLVARGAILVEEGLVGRRRLQHRLLGHLDHVAGTHGASTGVGVGGSWEAALQ